MSLNGGRVVRTPLVRAMQHAGFPDILTQGRSRNEAQTAHGRTDLYKLSNCPILGVSDSSDYAASAISGAGSFGPIAGNFFRPNALGSA
jgi:hypothetical protein